MATISIIVPIYKVEAYLHRCVDSILAQTFTDFELILVDDGSPDNCGAICDEYAEKDSRIHVIHKENGGLSSARNAGIDWAFEHSDSEWLTFIDSDDWIHPRYCEYLLNAAVEGSTSISTCRYIKVTEYVRPQDAEFSYSTADWLDYYLPNTVNGIVAVCKLYSKELFRELRYPEGRLHEDEFLTYKLLFNAGTIASMQLGLYYYFFNEDGIMRSNISIKRIEDAFDAFSEQCEFALQYGDPRFIADRHNAKLRSIRRGILKLEKAQHISEVEKRSNIELNRSRLKSTLAFMRKNHIPLKDRSIVCYASPLTEKVLKLQKKGKRSLSRLLKKKSDA